MNCVDKIQTYLLDFQELLTITSFRKTRLTANLYSTIKSIPHFATILALNFY